MAVKVGGPGNDSLIGTASADTLIGVAGDDSGLGGAGADYISGGPGSDVLTGGDGNDLLNGDELDGFGFGVVEGAGNDSLLGGAGDDYCVGGAGADLIDGGPGYDGTSYWLARGPIALDLGNPAHNTGDAAGDMFVSVEWFDGTDYADTLTGSAARDNLSGGPGKDTLTGLGGSDTLNGGNPDERGGYHAGATDAGDVVLGGGGNDLLIGGAGADTLAGGQGDDTFTVDAKDLVIEKANLYDDDTIMAPIGYLLPANVERLVLIGTQSINGTGNALGNVITGNQGNNVLKGGLGNDSLAGGGGHDRFAYGEAPGADNADVIVDFVTGMDKIVLNDVHFAGIGALGPMGAARFISGPGATAGMDASDRIIYDTTTGALYFDSDGDGAGGALLIATLQGAPQLIAADIVVT